MAFVPGDHALTSIIDNQGDNSLYNALQHLTSDGVELWIATAFFSLDALNMLGETLDRLEKVRLIFGGDASAVQRRQLLEAMRRLSDEDSSSNVMPTHFSKAFNMPEN